MNARTDFAALASGAAALARDVRPAVFLLEVRVGSEWLFDDWFAGVDAAADALVWACADSITARIIELHPDGQTIDVTNRAHAAIRAWLDLRGDDIPDWLT